MALLLDHLYDALRAGSVPDDKARAAPEEVANHGGEIEELRIERWAVEADICLLR